MSHTTLPWIGDFNAGPQVVGGVPLRLVASVERLEDLPLVVAAPDLLEALKAALAALETPGDLTQEEIGHVIEDAAAAIAKAEPSYTPGA